MPHITQILTNRIHARPARTPRRLDTAGMLGVVFGRRLRQTTLITLWVAYMTLAGVSLEHVMRSGSSGLGLIGWIVVMVIVLWIVRWGMRRIDRDGWLED